MTHFHEPEPWRALTGEERVIVEALLGPELPEKSAYVEHLAQTRIRHVACEHGGLSGYYQFEGALDEHPHNGPLSQIGWTDSKSQYWELLLWGLKGKLRELEVVQYFEASLESWPEADALDVYPGLATKPAVD